MLGKAGAGSAEDLNEERMSDITLQVELDDRQSALCLTVDYSAGDWSAASAGRADRQRCCLQRDNHSESRVCVLVA